MAKVMITPELSEALRTLRIENEIQSKDLAFHLKKSPSYITKLEKSEIRSIEKNELLRILAFVAGDQSGADEAISVLYKKLSIKYTLDEIKQMLWATNFDMVYRFLPIPEDFIADLNRRMIAATVTSSYLVKRINSNESIPPETENLERYPTNAYDMYTLPDGTTDQYIKLEVKEEHIDAILQRKITTANYITLLAMVFYLSKIESYGEKVQISDSERASLMKTASAYLEQYRVYSLERKTEIVQRLATQEELETRLSKHDTDNLLIAEKVASLIDLYSNFDIETANQELTSFVENMKWDAPLIMRIAGLEFRTLAHCSFRIKRQMLMDIEEVLKRYLDMPETEKLREEY